jgi:hypothetical protein
VKKPADNETELTSMAILKQSQESSVEWHCIASGKPRPVAWPFVATPFGKVTCIAHHPLTTQENFGQSNASTTSTISGRPTV